MDLVQTLGEWKSTSTGMFPVNGRRSNLPTECGWTSHTDRLLDIVAARWNRRWFMVPASVFITPLASDTDASNASLSLLLTVALVRLLASIDVKLEKSSLTIATAVTESTLPPLACFGMALQLDGQAHTLTSLPNGVTITTAGTIYGEDWNWREYEGRVAGGGASVDLVLVGKSNAGTMDHFNIGSSSRILASTDRRVRFCLALEDAEDVGEKCLSVFVEFQTASRSEENGVPRVTTSSCPTPGSVGEISDTKWMSELEIVATYVSLPA
ncbi:hypothetical protein L917_03657 [Phytophthora nicotianae]|uniref:Uncharacterized protein n=1 Tax=Phytophthora nicotianae TaxID=4792 RepID=W2LS35_PHYNI|nr:hypothetical protein L917_03657 [Phytophthora nicotianae]